MLFADAEVPLLPPLARFAVVMLILFTVPPLCRRARLPGVVGLLAAGVLVGPHGLHFAPRHAEVAHFFAEIGKLLLMFFAGLEIDLAQFNRTRNRSAGFGLLTFSFPLMAGTLVGLAAGSGCPPWSACWRRASSSGRTACRSHPSTATSFTSSPNSASSC